MWRFDFDMCNFWDRGDIEEIVQGVKSAAGGHHRANFVPGRVEEACAGNIVEDFVMRL